MAYKRRATAQRCIQAPKFINHCVERLLSTNLSAATAAWGRLEKSSRERLKALSRMYLLNVAAGELCLLDGRWYVTHTGLLRLAERRHCSGIRSIVEKSLCSPSESRWVFKATVYKSPRSRGFVGYGDADPSNVSSLVHGAEMRVAETRAVNRALRKAYGIGLCSVEELGWAPRSNASGSPDQRKAAANGNNGHHHGQPRLRDRLCLLIRQHQLDAGLVKAYAADYCGTPNPNATRRKRSSAHSPTATSLWPMLMPLATWTARGVCWNGKPRVLVIPINPRG